jgi:polyisoprenyl-phosphate glycosyltransferase
MLLSIVFSFRNEEDNIPELVRRTSEVANSIDDLQYEMIFVNDASTDKSVELLLGLQETHPITIITMTRKFGVTPCVLAGFHHTKGDAVIYMDSDLQDPPELITEMVEKFRGGADVVHMTRTEREGEGFLKLWTTKKAYKIINYFSDIHLPEDTGDFKLLSFKVIQQILKLKEYDPYMRGLSVWVGYKQEFINYKRLPRWGGETKFPIYDSAHVKEFLRGLTAYSATPLYIAFYVGLMTILISVCLTLWAIVSKLLEISSPGTSGILIAISFFSGVILMTNGLIGIYIARIFYEVKERPRYIISSIIEPNGEK